MGPQRMADQPGLFIQIYVDHDSTSALASALRERGFVAESALEAGLEEADDETQLKYATSKGMAILTRNNIDFSVLAKRWARDGRKHAGIIISEKFTREQFGELLRRTLKLLNTMTADEIQDAFVYLSQFR